MKINSYNGLLGRAGDLKNVRVGNAKLKVAGTESKAPSGTGLNVTDNVEISAQGGLQRMSVAAEGMMSEFKTALIQSIPGYQAGSSMGELNSINGTQLDSFIKTRFANTSAESKREFMSYFNGLSMTSDGLVSSKVVSQAFGSSNGFGSMISEISNSLSKYL